MPLVRKTAAKLPGFPVGTAFVYFLGASSLLIGQQRIKRDVTMNRLPMVISISEDYCYVISVSGIAILAIVGITDSIAPPLLFSELVDWSAGH